MKFKAYYSSSKVNLYCVTAANGKRILIECGVTWAKLQKALSYDLTNIVGCLLTHEHSDHSKAIEDVLTAGIDVYASEGTFKAIDESLHLHRKANVVRDKGAFIIADTFDVFPFEVNHDAKEPLGFVVYDSSSKENLLFVTDTRSIKPRFGLAFDIIAICCGYDVAVLRQREASGDIDPSLAKRLLTSHMEQETTKAYIRDQCCTDKLTEIHLLHMSGDNIDKERVRAEIEAEFFTKTYIAGQAAKASPSSRPEPPAIFERE